jgi:hypothetical protein
MTQRKNTTRLPAPSGPIYGTATIKQTLKIHVN